MNRAKKALHILSWVPVGLFKLALVLLGLLVVPFVIGIGAANKELWPDIFWLWGNKQEDPPQWWLNKAKWLPTFRWYAIRNPANNMRYIFDDREANVEGNWITDPMEAKQLIEAGQQMAYRWSYNGPFAGYRRVWITARKFLIFGHGEEVNYQYSEIWFGWKVGSKVPGLGFTSQVRLKREIGT